MSLSDAWENISLTDTANINKHEWAINSFIQDGQDFRSPLIDLWEEVEVVEVNSTGSSTLNQHLINVDSTSWARLFKTNDVVR